MENDLKILFSNDQGWNKINYNNKSIIYKGYLYNNNFTNIIKNIFKIKNKRSILKI